MQSPLTTPIKTLNPNVTFPLIGVVPTGVVPGARSAGSGSMAVGGSIRPPPVHFRGVHGCSPPTQKLGRFSAVLRFVWSLQAAASSDQTRSEEHTSELQSQSNLVCRLLLEKKKKKTKEIDRDTLST